MKRKFIKAYCNHCDEYLCEAPEDSKVYCPDCKKWQTVESEVSTDEQ